MSETLLDQWRKSATDRAEFAAILQEPIMQKAINIVREAIFAPINPPTGMAPVERMAFYGEMGLRREAGLVFLKNFLNLANIQTQKAKAQDLQKQKPWDTADKEAGEKLLLSEFYGGNPPPLETPTGATGATGANPDEPVSPEPQNPQT
jgi:hypothetical protein